MIIQGFLSYLGTGRAFATLPPLCVTAAYLKQLFEVRYMLRLHACMSVQYWFILKSCREDSPNTGQTSVLGTETPTVIDCFHNLTHSIHPNTL